MELAWCLVVGCVEKFCQRSIGNRKILEEGRRRSRHGFVELVCDGVTTVSREMPHDNKRHEHIHHEDSASTFWILMKYI